MLPKPLRPLLRPNPKLAPRAEGSIPEARTEEGIEAASAAAVDDKDEDAEEEEVEAAAVEEIPKALGARFEIEPSSRNPRYCVAIEEVRPASSSCGCRNTLVRARPLPLSSVPDVSTPIKVLLPEPSAPNKASRTLGTSRTTAAALRITTSASLPLSPCDTRVIVMSASRSLAMPRRVCRDSRRSPSDKPSGRPSS